MTRFIATVLTVVIPLLSNAQLMSAVESAVIEAKMNGNISFEEKIRRGMTFFQSGAIQKNEPKGKRCTYDEDNNRSAETILKNRDGGACGSTAIAFGAMLEASGINKSRIRYVETVLNRDLVKLCPNKNEPRLKDPNASRVSVSGHVWMMIQDDNGQWYFLNPRIKGNSPYLISAEAPPSAEALQERPVQMPYPNLEYYLQLGGGAREAFKDGASIVAVFDEIPKHSLEDRYNLAASGRMNNNVCRHGAEEIMREHTYNVARNASSSSQTPSTSAKKAN